MVKKNLYRNNRKTFCKQNSVTEELQGDSNPTDKSKRRRKQISEWKSTNSTENKNLATNYFSKDICLNILTNICIKSDYKIVKTIRISMDLVQTLIDFIPSLKVIHLLRDPRAITNSRKHSGKFNMKKPKGIKTHSIALCKEMHLDIKVTKVLKHKYPKRITMVMYEALAEHSVEGAQYVYKFLNTEFDSVMEDWIYNSTHANKNNGFYGTHRTNSTAISSHWRMETTFEKVKLIQRYCKDVMNLLGYVSFNSQEELGNLDIPARQKTKIPGLSWVNDMSLLMRLWYLSHRPGWTWNCKLKNI